MIEPIDVSQILPAYNEEGRIQQPISTHTAYLRRSGYQPDVIVAEARAAGTHHSGREVQS